MFRKKKPPPKTENAEPQEEDAIIDLTEEMVIKAEEDNGAIKSTEKAEKDSQRSDDKDKTIEDKLDERDIGLPGTGKLEPADDDFTVEPIVSAAGDEVKIKNDPDIASANAESQAPEADEDPALTEDIDLNLLKEEDDDEDPANLTDASTADNKTHEDDLDLRQEPELEFELEDDGDELIAAEDDNDLFLEPEEKIKSASTNEDVIMALKDTLKDEDDFVGLDDEEPPEDENDYGLLDLDDTADLEGDDSIIPLDDLDTDHDDDIIEITELDEDFPADDEALLEQAGMLNTADSEKEDFLELIDLAEEKLLEEEDRMDFDGSATQLEKDEVNHLFSDGLEEELQKKMTGPSFNDEIEDENQDNDTIKTGVGDALDQNGRIRQDDEELLAGSRNLASEASYSALEDEKLDLNFDPDKILQPGDRLDAFLSEDSVREPASSSSLLDQIGDKNVDAEQNDLTARLEMDELPAVTPAQIEAAVERVISQKFSGQIEDIIYKAIEKAVTKEIDRLKRALLANDASDDSS